MTLRDVDFLRPPGPSVLGKALLVLGALVFAASLAVAQRAAAVRAERIEQAARAERALATARRVPRPADDEAAERRARQAWTELHRPWLPALRAVESAAVEPVYLLSLSMESATGRLRLDAEAPDFGQALAQLQALGASGALADVRLVGHDQATDAAGGRSVVRFTVHARWLRP